MNCDGKELEINEYTDSECDSEYKIKKNLRKP